MSHYLSSRLRAIAAGPLPCLDDDRTLLAAADILDHYAGLAQDRAPDQLVNDQPASDAGCRNPEVGQGRAVHPAPAPFEAFRRFAAEAVDQLVKDMATQALAYAVPAEEPLALIKTIARIRRESPWSTLDSWALRHAVPVHELATRLMPDDYVRTSTGAVGPSAEERRVLQARLRDLLGYCVLGLVLAEETDASLKPGDEYWCHLAELEPYVPVVDESAQTLRTLAAALRKVLPPAMRSDVIAHCDPLTPFLAFLRDEIVEKDAP